MTGLDHSELTGHLDFDAPAGLRVRGTVVVAPGRGESAETYQRFGRRIAADAYRVRILGPGSARESLDEQLGELAAALSAAVDIEDELPRPLVLVGTDTSAAALSALVGGASGAEATRREAAWWPDALVLAAIPGYGTHEVGGDWDSELAVRTHCPAHRGVLTGDPSLARGTLAEAVSEALLDQAYANTAALPQLLLVGDQDPLADPEALATLAGALPRARLSVVRGAHHDVLNDLQHRTVAAEVVTFLEILRDGSPLQPLVTVAASAW